MGLDVYAKLVAGAEMEKVHKVTKQIKEVTKYNCDTGEPYKTKFTETIHIFGTKVCTEKEWCGFDPGGQLEFFHVSGSDPAAIGIKIAETESHRNGCGVIEVNKDKIEDALAQAKIELKQFGIEEADVNILMIPVVSC